MLRGRRAVAVALGPLFLTSPPPVGEGTRVPRVRVRDAGSLGRAHQPLAKIRPFLQPFLDNEQSKPPICKLH